MRITRTASAVSGGALIVLYLGVATLSYRAGLLPVRPFYQGTAPPAAYRWVEPPPALAPGNAQPDGVVDRIPLGAAGSEARTVTARDMQAGVTFLQGVFAPSAGDTAVRVEIRARAPGSYGGPPGDLRYDGNVYEFTATYEPSGRPASPTVSRCDPNERPKRCPVVMLRFAAGSTTVLRRAGDRWEQLQAQPVHSNLQLFVDTPTLGAFVPAGVIGAVPPPGSKLWLYVGSVLGAAVLGAGVALARMGGWRKRWRAFVRWMNASPQQKGRARDKPRKRKR